MPFREIIGHQEIVNVLKRTLLLDKLAHAYIFAGVEGCGKRLTALALVQEVFCSTLDSCGECPACRKLAAGQHPDLHLIEPDGQFIKIEQVRQLQKELAYRPFEAPRKATIIDQADRLNLASGNALLKTLEEPPGNALIILVTANPNGVLPTILSRCQTLSFPPLTQETVARFLMDRGYAQDTASIAATLSGGSLKRALDVSAEATLGERGELLRQIDSLSMDDISPILILAEKLSADKDNVIDILDLLATYLRDIILLQNGSDNLVNHDLVPLVRKRAEHSSSVKIMEVIGHVFTARQAMQRNVNPRLTLEVLFMRLASAWECPTAA